MTGSFVFSEKICNFAAVMYRVYDILRELFGESRQGGYCSDVTQYQFNCPFCAAEKGEVDGKYNMEISFSLGKYHCWSCNSAGPLSRLIAKWGGRSRRDEYFSIIRELRESRYFDLRMFEDSESTEEKAYLTLPEGFRSINLDYCHDKSIRRYLIGRGLTQDIIDYYNIGYKGWDDDDYIWRNRIIIPSYDASGDLNYFIGRTYREGDGRIKYRNCPVNKNTIVLHEDKIQWDADIYLVEGAIDCLYYPNSIALLGKFLNEKTEVYKRLQERAMANVVICLDGDTTIEEVKRLYRILDQGNLRGRVRYIRLGTGVIPYKDFGEIYEAEGKCGIIRAMKEKKSFNEFEILK